MYHFSFTFFFTDLFIVQKMSKYMFSMFIYTDDYTESDRNTENKNLCPKPRQKKQMNFRKYTFLFSSSLSKIKHSENKQKCMLVLMALLISNLFQQ